MAARGRQAGFQMGAEHRSKIGNSKILSELIKFAEGGIDPEKFPPHRVSAALGLLKKVMPDLTQNDTNINGKLDVIVRIGGDDAAG